MPRKAGLDDPGIVAHVIVRGIEKRNIFFDDTDRHLCVTRLTDVLSATETECFARHVFQIISTSSFSPDGHYAIISKVLNRINNVSGPDT